MDVLLVVAVRSRPQHRGEPRAYRMQHALAQFARHRAIGECNRLAIGKFQPANVERIGVSVFRQFGAGDAVAAAAIERVEIVEIADGAAEARRQRRHVGADPVRDRGRHGAAEGRRGLQRNPPFVWQHHGFQPHQILAAAIAGTLDVGDAGGDRDRVCQRQPASRRRWRGRVGFDGRRVGRTRRRQWRGCGLFGRLVSLDRRRLFRRRGLFGFDDRRIGRTRLRQRHRRGERRECCLPPRLRPGLPKLRPVIPKQIAPQTMTMLPSRDGLGLRAKHQQHCCNGNHCREGATKALTRPFAACFLRAKVHGNSMKTCDRR